MARRSAFVPTEPDTAGKLFREIDKAGSGYLTQKEVTHWCEQNGFPPAFADDFVVVADTDGDGRISLKEFQVLLNKREGSLRKAFSAMDCNGDGVISRQELEVGLQDMLIRRGRPGWSSRISQKRAAFIVESVEQEDGIDFEAFKHALFIVRSSDLQTVSAYRMRAHWNNGFADTIAVPYYKRRHNLLDNVIAGGIAGAASKAMTYPIDVVVARAKLDNFGLWQISVHIMKNLGIPGFYRGCCLNSASVVPWKSLDFLFYDEYKRLLTRGVDEPTDTQRILAGAFGGATTLLMLYPLSFLVARLQVDDQGLSLRQQTRQVLQNAGLRGLYAGVTPGLVAAFPFSGVTYGAYDVFKQHLAMHKGGNLETLTPWEKSLCGATAGWAGMTCVYPLGVVSRRMGVQGMQGFDLPWQRPYISMTDAFKRIILEEGLSSLYGGWALSSLKVVPASAFQFGLYEILMDYLKYKG